MPLCALVALSGEGGGRGRVQKQETRRAGVTRRRRSRPRLWLLGRRRLRAGAAKTAVRTGGQGQRDRKTGKDDTDRTDHMSISFAMP